VKYRLTIEIATPPRINRLSDEVTRRETENGNTEVTYESPDYSRLLRRARLHYQDEDMNWVHRQVEEVR
jgi:hypothetical protein